LKAKYFKQDSLKDANVASDRLEAGLAASGQKSAHNVAEGCFSNFNSAGCLPEMPTQQRNHYLEILFVHTRRHRSILKFTDRNKLELAGDQ